MRKALLILASLAIGLLLGMMTTHSPPIWQEIASTTGTLWLSGLQMTVIPLVIALLIVGIVQTAQAASTGRLAGTGIAMMMVLLFLSSVSAAIVVPTLTSIFPIPEQAAAALRDLLVHTQSTQDVPTFGQFLRGIVPTNPFAAATEGNILQLLVFAGAFAFAATRLPSGQRATLTGFFEAIANTLIIIVGWVLWLAPIGVLALAYTLGRSSGAAAFGALAHYVVILVMTGGVIWLSAYALAIFGAKLSLKQFIRAAIPAQAVAISTQSSIASLPAMLAGLDQLGTRRPVSEMTLPIAVALYRSSGPAMNLGVALYVAHWMGITLTPWQMAMGILLGTLTTIGSVSLPGTISFISSIAPICIAMGVPIEPLGLLVAIETFPDIMRTLSNVTMDMALTATLDRRVAGEDAFPPESA